MKSGIQYAEDDWDETSKEPDRMIRNNNRKHSKYRDNMDITVVDRDKNEDEHYPTAKLLKLSNPDDWLDIIYSRRYQDLHQLVTDENLSQAISKLTDNQKEVLFLNVIKQFTIQEIAIIKDTSDRNIRKLRQKAIENIQKTFELLKDRSGDCDARTAAMVLGTIIFWPFLVGWKVANWIYPKKAA